MAGRCISICGNAQERAEVLITDSVSLLYLRMWRISFGLEWYSDVTILPQPLPPQLGL